MSNDLNAQAPIAKRELSYDRRARPSFRSLVEGGGALAGLAERAHHTTLLDLQYRGNKITLYYGLTNLLSVRSNKNDEVKFVFHTGETAHQASMKLLSEKDRRTLDSLRTLWTTERSLRSAWPAISAYLDRLIPEIRGRWTSEENEGAVQSALERTERVATIDREVVMSHRNAAERGTIKRQIVDPYLRSLVRRDSDPAWWGTQKSFGAELDLMCVDDLGRLLLVELKPASASRGIAWAPAQAAVYCDYFSRWEQQDRERAHLIIEGMLEQRLALIAEPAEPKTWRLRKPLEIVPVVGIGGTPSHEALRRMVTVQQRLRDGGIGYQALELWRFDKSALKRNLWNELEID